MEETDRDIPPLFTIGLMQILLGLLAFTALLHRQQELAILALLVMLLMGGARWWARASMAKVTCRYSIDKAVVFPGEKLVLSIRTTNNKFLPIRHRLEVPIPVLLVPEGYAAGLRKSGTLWWHQTGRFQWELIAQKRGVYQAGPPRVLTGDLFSFYFREKIMGDPRQVIVYPRLVPLLPFTLPKRDFFGTPGAESPVQDPVYILGTRDYQYNQPAKHIHWKASARHNRLQEKVFEPSIQEKALVLIDVAPFAGHQAEKEFEQTLEIAASLSLQLLKRGCALGFGTNGVMTGHGTGMIPVSRGPQQLSKILGALAGLKMEPVGDFMHILSQGFDLPWGVSCIHFSYEEGPELMIMEKFLYQRRIPMISFICQSSSSTETDTSITRSKVHNLKKICMAI